MTVQTSAEAGPGPASETVWEEHAHPTHELLWTQRGASSATTDTRTWTITPMLGLWVLAGGHGQYAGGNLGPAVSGSASGR